MSQPDVGDTHKRIAHEIQTCRTRIQDIILELRSIADECEELGLLDTAEDIDSAIDRIKYAKDECLEHRTVAPLG
jgi:hypothetical protein